MNNTYSLKRYDAWNRQKEIDICPPAAGIYQKSGSATHQVKRGLVTFFLLLSFTLFANPKKKIYFHLQPYKNVSIRLKSQKLKYHIVKRDKTWALIRLSIVTSEDSVLLEISKKGYRPATLTFDLTNKKKLKKQVVVLDKISSYLHFKKYIYTGDSPKSVTFIDNNRVAVPLLRANGVDIVDIHSGNTIRIAPPKKWSKRNGFVESLVLKDKDELYITQMTTSTLHKFSLSTLQYKGSLHLKGRWSKVIIYDKEHDWLLVSNWESHNISVIDRKSFKEIRRMKTFGVPRGMRLSQDNKSLYVALFIGQNRKLGGGQMLKISYPEGKRLTIFGSKGSKRHVVKSSHNSIFVSDMGKRTVEIYENDSLVLQKKVFYNPNTICLSKNEQWLFVSSRGRNNPDSYLIKGFNMGRITILDALTLDSIEELEGGNQTTGLDVSPDGKYLVFSDFLDNAIRVYFIDNR